MIAAIQSAARACAEESYSFPGLSCLRLEAGRATGYDGGLAISEPVAIQIDAAVNAKQLLRALKACTDAPTITTDPRGALLVKAGKFKAFAATLPIAEIPRVFPEGVAYGVSAPILPTLKKLSRFIGHDPAQQWNCGVLFSGNSAFATNGTTIVEHWQSVPFPRPVNVPDALIVELLKRNEEPISLQLADDSLTFHFTGGGWMRSQLSAFSWPDLTRPLSAANATGGRPLTEDFFKTLKTVKPFTDEIGRILFVDGAVTSAPTKDAPKGATVATNESPGAGSYQVEALLALEGVAHTADFSNYPQALPFYGDGLRGVLCALST